MTQNDILLNTYCTAWGRYACCGEFEDTRGEWYAEGTKKG
jgi:hypothetical protein